MKKMIALSTAGVLATSAAYAGGLTAAAPAEPLVMSPAPVASAADWTGGYAGLSLGYGGIDAEGDDVLEDLDDDNLLDVDLDGDGAIGGGFAGYQHDFGSFVLGGELDLNAANIDFDEDDFFGGDIDFDGDGEAENGGASFEGIHRLKLRAGYDAGNALIYGVAGAAYAKAEIFGEDYSDTGYVVGAGVDYKVRPNVTVGGEILYHNWDDFDDTGVDFDATTVQARVAYQF